jgi:hypothetical protein
MNRTSIQHAQEGEYRLITHEFAALMEWQLMANEHKGQWREWRPDGLEGVEQLMKELTHHQQKLSTAMKGVVTSTYSDEISQEKARVREYAADMANFLMKAVEMFGI